MRTRGSGEQKTGDEWGGNVLLQVDRLNHQKWLALWFSFHSQYRDPNFKSKEEKDDDDGFDFGLDNIDYDNLNFYEMEMYPSSMYDPEEGPPERCL